MTQLSEIRNCLEGNTMSNPVHTSVTRMCGVEHELSLLPGGQYIAKCSSVKAIWYSLPG